MANPFPLVFEELLPYFQVQDGSCTVFEGPAPKPFPAGKPNPVTHIRIDQEWGVRFLWTTTGNLNYLMAGKWRLLVYLEQMGGKEFTLPNNVKELPFESKPETYQWDFKFPAGSVPDEGAYRVVTTVDMEGPGGFQGPISGVGEGPILRFYKVGLP